MKRWIEPHIRDTVVDFVQYWEKRAELKRGLFLHSLGLRRNKFSSWESRYGKDNFHIGLVSLSNANS